MAKTLIANLLSSSTYSLNPLGGEAHYTTTQNQKLEILKLVPSGRIDKNIPYPLLNPLQTLFFTLYDGGNSIVFSPTSSGKSLLSFLFSLKHDGKMVYATPTRSLASEKRRELSSLFGKCEIRTGESLFENFKNSDANVIVATFESFASGLRNNQSWAEGITHVVIDEVHQITKRWVVEELISVCLSREIKLLCLSATLPKIDDFISWINPSLVIKSDWRPTILERSTHRLVEEFKPFCKASGSYEVFALRLLNAIYSLSEKEEQVLIFVPSKKLGWKVLELASREKIGILNQTLPFEIEHEGEPELAFHSADVPKEEREDIEKAFREGRLRKLIATQTLAYGVNLPADRVIISVRGIKEKNAQKVVPDALDIMQMEGRAGRFGIKDRGYSNILIYSVPENLLEKEFKNSFETSIKNESTSDIDTISFIVLLMHLYGGKDFRRFLRSSISFKEIDERSVNYAREFLQRHGYIDEFKLMPKGKFCVRSNVPPTRLEEALRRKSLNLEDSVVIRPLLHTKRFDSLEQFLLDGFLLQKLKDNLLLCGLKCLKDNTYQFLAYIKGITARVKNLKNPPGEFSYLYNDALFLLRNLIDSRKQGLLNFGLERELMIAHSVKYGIEPEFASIGGIRGIGHIRANMIKLTLEEAGINPPSIASQSDVFYETLSSLEEVLLEKLVQLRKLPSKKAKEETKAILKLLQRNLNKALIDEKILLAWGIFTMGERALSMKKQLLELLREELRPAVA
ncbi:MAG: helicase-related protein [Aquificaceae bacterium]|nr:helicase-related protein [Aquificaceae bacterium]MDW8237389.1 helicase-related protein [Aquificaceae bacterium]